MIVIVFNNFSYLLVVKSVHEYENERFLTYQY